MKKTIVCFLLSFSLLVPLLALNVSAESITVNITDVDGICDDDNGDGLVFLFENKWADKERVVSSEEHNLRYMFIMVFDKDGKCVQIGNNLVFASRDANFQNYVVIPPKGFMLTFFFNADEAATNINFYNYYQSLSSILSGKTEEIYNRTLKIESDFSASVRGMTATLKTGTYGNVLGDCTDTDPDDDNPIEVVESPPENIPANGTYAKITEYDTKCSCYNGELVVINNKSDSEQEFLSDNYDFRYQYVFVFDKDGSCIELGNNLVMKSTESSFQNGVKVPAGGFIAAFFYHATEGPKNANVLEKYNKALGDTSVANATIPPVNELKAYIEDDYLVLYLTGVKLQNDDAEVSSDGENSVPDEDDSQADENSESGDSSTDSEETSADDTETDESVTPDESGDASSENESSELESESEQSAEGNESEGESNAALIVIICVIVAAVIAAIVIIIIKKKKK